MTHTAFTQSKPLLPCSVIIGCHGRREHLLRQLNSLLASNSLPQEVVLVTDDVDSDTLVPLQQAGIVIQLLPVQWAKASGDDENHANQQRFDIGRQRAWGALHASEEWLVFLDVDCMVDATFLPAILDGLRQTQTPTRTLLMGEPYYLPIDEEMTHWFAGRNGILKTHWQQLGTKLLSANEQHWQQAITELAIPHPRRPAVSEFVVKTNDYGSFWSLCFALHQTAYESIGGFDTSYTGYGAEDTDFAFTAKELGVEFYLCQARAYHQQHAVYRPPLNHLQSIVNNANRFYGKWGKWAMGGWLRQFHEMGLIEWTNEQTKPIVVLREPSRAQLEQAYAPTARFV